MNPPALCASKLELPYELNRVLDETIDLSDHALDPPTLTIILCNRSVRTNAYARILLNALSIQRMISVSSGGGHIEKVTFLSSSIAKFLNRREFSVLNSIKVISNLLLTMTILPVMIIFLLMMMMRLLTLLLLLLLLLLMFIVDEIFEILRGFFFTCAKVRFLPLHVAI